jgi:hypothetical protein
MAASQIGMAAVAVGTDMRTTTLGLAPSVHENSLGKDCALHGVTLASDLLEEIWHQPQIRKAPMKSSHWPTKQFCDASGDNPGSLTLDTALGRIRSFVTDVTWSPFALGDDFA